MNDENFEPVLGRIRANSPAGKRYAARVLAAAQLSGPRRAGGPGPRLSRLGRGAGAAAVIGARPGRGGRRAVVKTRLVRLHGQGFKAARAHLRYIQRDGVQRDGSPGKLYCAAEDEADGKAFIDRAAGDRHQFRIIVSAEDGGQYEDLKPLVRRFMASLEKDLGTSLSWVAADHLDTGHPHSHIILRGKDELGQNLVIARDYIAHGMRSRLSELVTLDLGPRTELEIQANMRLEVEAERLTGLDRSLVRSAGEDGILFPAGRSMAEHSIRLARLGKLQSMGLAEELEGGRWRLAQDLGETLRTMGERGDIVRTMQRAMKRAGLDRPAGRLVADGAAGKLVIVGRIVERGLADELNDRHYLIVDALDGRTYHVPVSADQEVLPAGSIVKVGIGQGAGGALNPEICSVLPVERLAVYDGATWLDRELASEAPLPLRDEGFGREVRSALAARRQWLIEQGLGDERGGRFALPAGALLMLERRDIERTAARIGQETGLGFARPVPGEQIEGRLGRRVDLGSGRYAMIETGREFMLVPWKASLERHLGKEVSGIARDNGISWKTGWERGPQIG